MSDTRIYVVLSAVQAPRLVEATSQAQAIRHCVLGSYKAEVATSKAVARYVADGLKVEVAGNGILENPHATSAP